MENETGKLIGYCPLFDHDHAFSEYTDILSQTTEERCTLKEAALLAQNELNLDLSGFDQIEKPEYLTEKQWQCVIERKEKLCYNGQ